MRKLAHNCIPFICPHDTVPSLTAATGSIRLEPFSRMTFHGYEDERLTRILSFSSSSITLSRADSRTTSSRSTTTTCEDHSAVSRRSIFLFLLFLSFRDFTAELADIEHIVGVGNVLHDNAHLMSYNMLYEEANNRVVRWS
jgi:hypothetical protein